MSSKLRHLGVAEDTEARPESRGARGGSTQRWSVGSTSRWGPREGVAGVGNRLQRLINLGLDMDFCMAFNMELIWISGLGFD